MSANPLALERFFGAWSPKLACAVVLALVFLAGGVVGALVLDFGIHSRTRTPSFDTAAGRADYFDRLRKDLALSEEQSTQVQSILEDFWQYYRTVLSDARQRIDVVLTPEQKVKFNRILQSQPK